MRWLILAFAGVLAVPAVASAQARLPKGQAEVNRATEMIVRGDFAGAEPLLRRAVIDAPNDPESHYNLAVVLRNTGHPQEAVPEYHRALDIFEAKGPRPNGEADLGRCLYGIALAQEQAGDPRVAAAAWDNYIRFAKKYQAEQPAVQIAKMRMDGEMRAANMRGPYPFGPPTATRPNDIR
jgi:tetratricopeptide (TPR) repeat protein